MALMMVSLSVSMMALMMDCWTDGHLVKMMAETLVVY